MLENIHCTVNIGLVNEMKIIADRMGIDIFEVIDTAATKPFGFVPYFPSPGLGGHCMPIDPFCLSWKACEYDVDIRFIELAGAVNTAMPDYVIGKLVDALNDHYQSINDSKILILEIAYKKNVDDIRKSLVAKILEKLVKKGANVEYSDPNVLHFPKMRDHNFDLVSMAITPEPLSLFDAVLLVNNHDAFDYELIQGHSKLVIDTHGRYRQAYENVVRA